MSESLIVSTRALDQYLELLGEDGRDFIIDIIDTLIEEYPNNFDELERSLVNNDYRTFQRAAHTLKTNCSTVGANGLAKKFLELEKSGSAKDLSSVEHIVEECKDTFIYLKDELLQKKRMLMIGDYP